MAARACCASASLDMKSLDVWRMLGVAASMLLLAVAVLVIRYGHVRYPYNEHLQDRTQSHE